MAADATSNPGGKPLAPSSAAGSAPEEAPATPGPAYSRGTITLLMVAFTLCGAVMTFSLVAHNPNLGSDSLGYLLPMHNYVAGKGYSLDGLLPTLDLSPGYGLLAYAFYWLVKDVALSGMLVSALAYIFTIPLAYRVAASLFGQRAGLLAAFLVLFFPAFITASYITLSEAVFTFFLLASFHAYTRLALSRGHWGWAVLTGALLGYAYLIRPEGFLPALLCLASLFGLAWKPLGQGAAGPGAFPRRLGLALAALLCFLAVAGPYVNFLKTHLGFWTISGKTAEVFMRAGARITEGQNYSGLQSMDDNDPQRIVSYALKQKEQLILRVKNQLVTTFEIVIKHTLPALVPLLLLWLTLPLRASSSPTPPEARGSPAWFTAGAFLIFLSPLAVLPYFLVLERYLVPFGVFLLIVLAALTVRLLDRHGLPRSSLGLAGVMLVSLLAVTAPMGKVVEYLRLGLPNPPDSLSRALTQPHGNKGLQQAGLWLQKQHPDGRPVRVLTPNKGIVLAFYANGQRLEGPVTNKGLPDRLGLEQVAQLLRKGEADLLVLDNYYTRFSPTLMPLWSNPGLAAGWGLRQIFQDPAGTFQIYGRGGERETPPPPAESRLLPQTRAARN